MSTRYHYFVEGECEEKLIKELKTPPLQLLVPGRIEVFNFINKEISNQRIVVLKPDTVVVLVYDVDVDNTEVLKRNLSKLRNGGIKRIVHIQSILNFEDEIVYSTSIENINEMYDTRSLDHFKRMFLKQNDLYSKLRKMDFDVSKLWSRANSNEPFCKFSNKSDLKIIKNIK